MKKIIKYFGVILISILFLFGNMGILNAASGSISVSSGTSRIVVGNTFSVTVTLSSSVALGSWEWTISYDTSKFKLVSGEKTVADVFQNTNTKSKSYTYKFKAIATGSGKISVKSYGAIALSDNSNIKLSVGSKTVTVITQAQLESSYSKNNNLKSLSVDGYKLSPTFSKSVTEYTVEAGANVETVNIKASAEDSKSSVSGTGKHEVSEGENKFNISVKAENGSIKTYKIIVKVNDPNPINVTIKDKNYVVVKRESTLEPPENFTKTIIDIDGQNIPAFYNETNNITLVGLKDSEGTIDLFKYDNSTNTYSEYIELKLNQMKISPLPIEKEFDKSYAKSTTLINNIEFESLKMNNSKYSIIHAINLDEGSENYYLYDELTNTMIRYTDENTKPLVEELENYKLIIMVLGIETILITFILIGILIAKIKNNKKRKRLYNEEKEKRQKAQVKDEKKEENNDEAIKSTTTEDNTQEEKKEEDISKKDKKTKKNIKKKSNKKKEESK